MLRFVITLMLAALIFWAGLIVGVNSGWIQNKPSFSFEILVLLFTATLIIFFYLYRVSKNIFVQLYLLTMAVKIIAYVSFILIMVQKDRSGALGNVVFFMLVYIVFTALEIGFLYRRINASGGPL